MNRRKPITARQLAREKLLFRYSSALERGDFDTLAVILREAEADPTLEKMLAEMDAVYRAELAPLPVLPTLSANHNHRHTREDETMNVTYPTISRRLPDTRSRGRWNSAATLAAAMVALVLFAAVLIARRPPPDPQQGNPGIVMQNETATPIPSLTATPLIHLPIVSLTPTPVEAANNQGVLCEAFVNLAAGINVLSRPSEFGVAMGYLPLGTQLTITDTASDSISWFFVNGMVDDIPLQGWVSAADLSFTGDQSCPIPPEIQAMQATSAAMGIQPISPEMALTLTAMPPCPSEVYALPTFTPTWTPTPAPGLQVEPIDGIYTTATALVQSVVATQTAQITLLQPTIVSPCGTIPQLSITPTAGIPYGAWNSTMLREAVDGIPANTSVRIGGAYFDGTQWLYAIETLDQAIRTYAPESSLIIYAPPDATPIAVFDLGLRDGGYVLLTTEQVGDIPANALVRINSAQYNGSEWLYEVIAKDGETRGQAHDWQLMYAPDFVPGAATPTAMFGGTLGSGFYAAVTNQAVGNIPAGTRVQIGSAFYNGIEWNYNISDDSGRQNTARESQLDFAPDYTPGMATPTAAYFNLQDQILITLVQVGSIPARTPVQATSGYYDGTEWVYGVMTLDASAFADARASQLQAVSLDEAGVQPIPIPATLPPTPAPTFTLTFTPTPVS
jgi:hypothetical protein